MYRNEWLNACFGTGNAAGKIEATFKGGRKATYTMNIFGLLKSDPTTEMIVDLETGELLYERS